MVFAFVSVQGWIVDPNVNCFFHKPHEVWSSLLTIWKFSSVVPWPVVLKLPYILEGGFKCSLNLFLNVLEDSPVYSS